MSPKNSPAGPVEISPPPTRSRKTRRQQRYQLLEEIGAGGLSGKPIGKKSTEFIQYIAEKTNRQIPIIGSGGIHSPADAREKMGAGAELIQIWTGFIYEGPGLVKRILKVQQTGQQA